MSRKEGVAAGPAGANGYDFDKKIRWTSVRKSTLL